MAESKLPGDNQKENIKTDREIESPELVKKFDFWGIKDFIAFLRNPTKIFFLNLLAGIGRGFGFAIGFTILAAIVILLLRRAVSVPVIGSYIAKILEFIEAKRAVYP
ncbi:MAG: DUF5665 domain-containing protein [candidate division WOR-3 bacterium]|nr:DUF5665 domain-containing protein [candidate division WOR-3 bacterium]